MTPARLAAAIKEGGAEAALSEERLCALLSDRVRAYGLRHLRDRDALDDFVQRVLLETLLALRAGRLQDVDLVERFVLGICRNLRFSEVRESVRDRDIRTQSGWLQEGRYHPPSQRLDLPRLSFCLAALEGKARDVVLLSFQEGLEAPEIASKLEMTAGHVRVVRHRALASLRSCLTKAEAK